MGILFAFLSALSFSLGNVMVKKGQNNSEKNSGYFLSLLINVVILGILLLFSTLKEGIFQFSWVACSFFVLAGLLTTGLGRFAFFSALRRIGPSRASAIKNSAPIFTILFALTIIGETISFQSFLGISLLIGSIVLQGILLYKGGGKKTKVAQTLSSKEIAIALEEKKSKKEAQIGYIIVIIAAVSFGFGQGVRKQGLLVLNDAFLGAFIGALTALIIFTIVTIIRGQFTVALRQNFKTFNSSFLIAGVLLALGPLFFFLAASLTKVSYVASVAGTEPVLTIFLSALLLKGEEKITGSTWITVLLVVVGTCIIALA